MLRIKKGEQNEQVLEHPIRTAPGAQDPPSLEESIFAASGLTDDPTEQAEIAASLMGVPVETVRVAMLKRRQRKDVATVTFTKRGRAAARGDRGAQEPSARCEIADVRIGRPLVGTSRSSSARSNTSFPKAWRGDADTCNGLAQRATGVEGGTPGALGSAKDTEFGKLLVRPRDAGGVTMSVYCVVTDVDAHFARAKAAGAEITREPVTQDYGGRDYTAKDPEGHVWTFGTYDPWRRSRRDRRSRRRQAFCLDHRRDLRPGDK